MHKLITRRRIVLFLFVSLVLNIFGFQPANAGYSNFKDTISDSRPGLSVDHVIVFTTSIDVGDNGYYQAVFDSEFGDVSSAACSGGTVATTTNSVRCTYASAPGAATTTAIYIYGLANPPAAGYYTVDVGSYNAGNGLLENGQTIAIVTPGVTTESHIDSSLTFELLAFDLAEVNGITITGSSSTSTLPFGTLAPNASSTLAQTIGISTNAANGFSCTVEQDEELTNANLNTINSFDNSQDGTGSTTPHVWQAPQGTINNYNTYGHMGVTTDDFSLYALDFSGSKFAGLNGTDPLEIAYHDGPSSASSTGSGLAHVAFSIEISGSQETGDYSSQLTYICTPNY